MLRKILIVAAMLASTPAYAGNTQVNPDAYLAAGKTGYVYGRSDGVFQDSTSKGLWSVENDKPAMVLGPTYYEDFSKYSGSTGSLVCGSQADFSTCVDTSATNQILYFGDGLKLAAYNLANATLLPTLNSTGLIIAGDLTADEGWEVAGNWLGASGRPFVIGDDPAFYFCATVLMTDVSGTDDFHVGFRRAEPFNATFDNYLDLATIGNISGNIYIETIDDNAATTSTDTTDDWSDASTKKLCVYVSAAGVVTYKVDGSAPTTTAAFTFDDGDPVIPFVHLLHDTDIAEATVIAKWEVGYQP